MKLGALATHCEARLLGDGEVDVTHVAAVADALPGAVAFIGHAHDRQAARHTLASAVIADVDFAAEHAHELPCAVLVAGSPSRALRLAIAALHQRPPLAGRHESAVVDVDAIVADDVVISSGCVVEGDVVVGGGCVLHPGVILRRGVRLGERIRIGPGSVLGDDGFVFDDDGIPIAGVAGVVVGDDCWIGANVCIDRGLLRDTRLGTRCRVDNLVQIAHDVVLGDDVVVVAQTGIAGHVSIGDGCTFAGQSGVNPHVRVAPRVRVGGQAGVTHDVVDAGAVVAGTPAFAHHAWLKAIARLKRLDGVEQRLRALEGRAPPTHATSTTSTTSTTRSPR
jgi:UDP-3-O-[3-hydroxymyristoyl] glucosamine N-acyltransferase